MRNILKRIELLENELRVNKSFNPFLLSILTVNEEGTCPEPEKLLATANGKDLIVNAPKNSPENLKLYEKEFGSDVFCIVFSEANDDEQ